MKPDGKIGEEVEREHWPNWIASPDKAQRRLDEVLPLRARRRPCSGAAVSASRIGALAGGDEECVCAVGSSKSLGKKSHTR